MNNDLIVLGSTEYVGFPELIPQDGQHILAKIDTGAYSGAIHCAYLSDGVDEHGKAYVEYRAIDEKHPLTRAYKFKRVRVKSSNGMKQRRYLVNTNIMIRNQTFPIKISLTDRSDMSYDVILGRRFLRGKFLIDPSKFADSDFDHTNQ